MKFSCAQKSFLLQVMFCHVHRPAAVSRMWVHLTVTHLALYVHAVLQHIMQHSEYVICCLDEEINPACGKKIFDI